MLLYELTQYPVKGVKSTQKGPLVIPEDMQEIEEANLSGQLSKRNNLDIFIQKLQNKQPFVPVGATEATILLKPDPETIELLRQGQIPQKFAGEDGKMYSLTALQKTAEFGGRQAGFSTRDEDAALSSVNAQFAELKGTADAVKITIGDKTVSVAGFASTPGTPKSDFHAYDASGKEVAWISHKKGVPGTAKDFQQYGGLSDRELAAVYKEMPAAKEEINAFAKAIKERTIDGAMPRNMTLARKIQNGRLRGIAVYGNAFGGERGQQNVDLIMQGDPVFDGNKLTGTGPTHSNGERLEDAYEPIMMVRYSSDRNNFGIKGARMSISPQGSRKITEFI